MTPEGIPNQLWPTSGEFHREVTENLSKAGLFSERVREMGQKSGPQNDGNLMSFQMG